MEKLPVFCLNTYQHVKYGSQNNLNNRELSVFDMRTRNCQIPTVSRHTFTYHSEKMTGTFWGKYRNVLLLEIELREWKRSVTYGLGAVEINKYPPNQDRSHFSYVSLDEITDLLRFATGANVKQIAVIAVAPTGKACFVYSYVQTRLMGSIQFKMTL